MRRVKLLNIKVANLRLGEVLKIIKGSRHVKYFTSIINNEHKEPWPNMS